MTINSMLGQMEASGGFDRNFNAMFSKLLEKSRKRRSVDTTQCQTMSLDVPGSDYTGTVRVLYNLRYFDYIWVGTMLNRLSKKLLF